jgi:hypothetical protein
MGADALTLGLVTLVLADGPGFGDLLGGPASQVDGCGERLISHTRDCPLPEPVL